MKKDGKAFKLFSLGSQEPCSISISSPTIQKPADGELENTKGTEILDQFEDLDKWYCEIELH